MTLPGWVTLARRIIVRLHVRRRSQQPQIYRFHADRYHNFRVHLAAAAMQMQQLDSVPLPYVATPTFVVIRSSVEGVTWYKVDSAAPSSASTVVPPIRALYPFEVTTDPQWSQGSRPAIVLTNPTSRAAEVQVFYAVRDEDIGQGGGGVF